MEDLDKLAGIFENACEIQTFTLCLDGQHVNGCPFCLHCQKQCDFYNAHRYGVYEAARWGGSYIYYCRLGLTFLASPVYDDSRNVSGGILAGPVIMGGLENYDDAAVLSLRGILPEMSTRRVNGIAALMQLLTARDGSAKGMNRAEEQGVLLNELHEMSRTLSSEERYPIETEKALQAAIVDGDKQQAKEILNTLLGHIFFSSNGAFRVVRTRVLELIVLLSRASIDGGADVSRVFWLNNGYLEQINNFHTLEELSPWLNDVMNRFISYVFDFTDIKHADVMHRVIRYIRENYGKKLTLDEIADSVYWSKSYLSKVFKDEMGQTITAYISSVRIEKSKALLRDTQLPLVEVASAVGFDDQSYFTKTFRKLTGISPGKYRENRSRQI